MYTLEIGKDSYTINGEWTVKEWMELKKYDVSMELLWPRIISEASGAPIESTVEIPTETLQVGVALVGSLMQPAWHAPKKRLYDGKLVEFEKMSIGTFIDCETAVGRGIDKWLHLLVGSLYNVDIEKTKYWKISQVWGAVHNYLNWRLEVYKKYETLFEFDEVSEEDTGNSQDAAYAWYDMLMVLADSKFLNIKDASERPLYEALNFISWKKDQAKKEELERKKMKI